MGVAIFFSFFEIFTFFVHLYKSSKDIPDISENFFPENLAAKASGLRRFPLHSGHVF